MEVSEGAIVIQVISERTMRSKGLTSNLRDFA